MEPVCEPRTIVYTIILVMAEQFQQPNADKPAQPKHTGPVAATVSHPPSTNISQIVYDRDSQTLTIAFSKSGAVYEFYEVPEDVVLGFGQALSATKYFNAYVENSFPSQRVL